MNKLAEYWTILNIFPPRPAPQKRGGGKYSVGKNIQIYPVRLLERHELQALPPRTEVGGGGVMHTYNLSITDEGSLF